MHGKPIHQCECERCKGGDDEHEKEIHHQINVVMSRLDEQQQRWYAAVEANRHGHGGVKLVSKITGMNEKTIRRGRQELALDLADRPDDRIRLPGAGRPASEKKDPTIEQQLMDLIEDDVAIALAVGRNNCRSKWPIP